MRKQKNIHVFSSCFRNNRTYRISISNHQNNRKNEKEKTNERIQRRKIIDIVLTCERDELCEALNTYSFSEFIFGIHLFMCGFHFTFVSLNILFFFFISFIFFRHIFASIYNIYFHIRYMFQSSNCFLFFFAATHTHTYIFLLIGIAYHILQTSTNVSIVFIAIKENSNIFLTNKLAKRLHKIKRKLYYNRI